MEYQYFVNEIRTYRHRYKEYLHITDSYYLKVRRQSISPFVYSIGFGWSNIYKTFTRYLIFCVPYMAVLYYKSV